MGRKQKIGSRFPGGGRNSVICGPSVSGVGVEGHAHGDEHESRGSWEVAQLVERQARILKIAGSNPRPLGKPVSSPAPPNRLHGQAQRNCGSQRFSGTAGHSVPRLDRERVAGGGVDGDTPISGRYGRDLPTMGTAGRQEANLFKYGETSADTDMNVSSRGGQDNATVPMQHAVPRSGLAGSTPARQQPLPSPPGAPGPVYSPPGTASASSLV